MNSKRIKSLSGAVASVPFTFPSLRCEKRSLYESAEMRLHDIIWSGLSASIGSHNFDALIAPSVDNLQTTPMLDSLTDVSDRAALSQ